MIRQVVIIAGGKGTRMGKNSTLAKSLQPIQNKSILERQFEFFINNGFKEFLVLLGEKSGQIIEEIDKLNLKYEIKIDYLIEEYPIGTGGALLNALDLLDEQFILILGDIIINTELDSLTKSLDDKNIDFGLFYHASHHPQDSDLLKLNSLQIITDVLTKPRKEGLFRNYGNAGCYVFNKGVLSNLFTGSKDRLKLDLDRELIPELIKNGFIGKGVKNIGFIRDCGTPERLQYVQENWETIENIEFKRPAIFLDRDGTINKLNGFITSLDQIEVFTEVPAFISLMNKLNYWVIVITNQPVVARGQVTHEMLDLFHAKIEKIVSDSGGTIDDFFYCPHHPDSGFIEEITELKISCNCRKPEVGLIQQACERYPIDLNNSWMIGDTWRDAELASNIGINFIKINSKNDISSSFYSVNNLTEAAKIIEDSIKML
jgi:mannose-1-phosphate guanylyltransferase/phosphomannomutase